MSDLPEIIYSRRDTNLILEDHKKQLTAFTQGEWTDFLDASVDYAVVKTNVGLYDMNAFFCDRQVAETFLALALERESVIREAKRLGYIPKQAKPAVCTARITLPSFNTDFEIPANTAWSINGITFTCREIIRVSAQQTEVDITLVQGSPYNGTRAATGENWYKYLLPTNASNIQVKVNDEEWAQISTFIGVESKKSYKVYEDVGGQMILFGANLSTYKPALNDQISVSAILTDGKKGNIYKTDQFVRPVSVIRDPYNNQITNTVKGVTTTLALGGEDVENIDSIRRNAPKFWGTGGRAVTEGDWDVITRRYPGVTDVKVTGGEKVNQYRKVFITCYSDTPYEVAQEFIDDLTQYLIGYRIVGIQPVVKAPLVCELSLSVEVGVTKTTDEYLTTIRSKVSTAIVEYFSKLQIEYPMYQSDLAIASKISSQIKYLLFNFELDSFAMSHAGLIQIPVISNFDLTNCKLTDASNNTLFEGDGTSKVIDGYFTMVQAGLVDQKCNLHYKATDLNVEPGPDQVIVLKNLSVEGLLV